MSFADSYLGTLRAVVGSRPLLSIGARVLVENAQGQFLILKRADSGDWGLPGGAMELGESLLDVVHREAKEEVNATLCDVVAFGLSSAPTTEQHIYPNGDQVQNISLLAHGRLVNADVYPKDGEALEIEFRRPEDIPKETFVMPEYPTFSHWVAFQTTGLFQLV